MFIDGIMGSITYKKILAENLDASLDILCLNDDFVFQQDNDPKLKSRYVADFFVENRINLLEWLR